MSRIFISHSNEARNKLLTQAFCNWLDDEIGLGTYYVDYRHIPPGVEWDAELLRGIKHCETVILLLSRAWFDSRECQRELDRAVDAGKQIVPVLLEPGLNDDAKTFGLTKFQLCDLARAGQAVNVRVDHDGGSEASVVQFHAQEALKLKQVLRQNELDASSFRWPLPGTCNPRPYPGLNPLTEDDAGVFYGRTGDIQHVLEKIRQPHADSDAHILVIQGDSGVGKSSFLRAGILARLQRDNDRFAVLPVVRPGTGLVDGESGLLRSLEAFSRRSESPLAIDEVRERLNLAGRSLERLLQRLEADTRPAGARPRTIVLAIDQGEELFESGQLESFHHFVAPLLDRQVGDPTRVRLNFLLVLTIRSDHLHRLHGHDLFKRSKLDYYVLRPMNVSSYGDVIKGPTLRMCENGNPIDLEPELVDQLTAEARGADALPLLALTLFRLHEDSAQRENAKITLEQYEALARNGGVVEWALDKAFESPHKGPEIPATKALQTSCFKEIFPLIATVDAATRQTKRLIATRDSWRSGSPTDNVITRLVDHHLLRQTADHADSSRRLVEVAHEALFRQWQLFQSWLHESREKIDLLASIQQHSSEWVRRGREKAALQDSGSELSSALALRKDKHFGNGLKADDLAYLDACKTRRRVVRLTRAAPVALVLTLFLSAYWAFSNDLNLWTMFAVVPYLIEDAVGSLYSTTTPQVVPIPAPNPPYYDLGCKPGRDVKVGEASTCPYAKVSRPVALESVCAMSQSEVTFYQYDYFVWWTRRRDNDRNYPKLWTDARWNRPVVGVTINDARAYASWLTERSKSMAWRLPNEAEWEYAARDTPETGPYPWGEQAPGGQANCSGCNPGTPDSLMPVRSFAPNKRGLYDMAGNAAEWVEPAADDQASQHRAIIRSGAWNEPLDLQTVIQRLPMPSNHASESVGFRVCRVPKP